MTPETTPRLRIAIQKSGRLTDNSLDLLARCGLRFSRARDQLVCFGENLPLDVLLVRDDDIPGLVQEDACDLGIVGQNEIAEKRLALAEGAAPLAEVMALDFGRCRLAIAVPEDAAYAGPDSIRGRRVATSYPRVLGRWLAERGVPDGFALQRRAEEVPVADYLQLAQRLAPG